MRLRYFAWVRERIGKSEEDFALPPQVKTAADLLAFLAGQGEEYAHALVRPDVIRIALDKRHAPHDAPLAGVHEVALFPPMTGG
jgi:molybdopterin synthase sulfur carrier subunit